MTVDFIIVLLLSLNIFATMTLYGLVFFVFKQIYQEKNQNIKNEILKNEKVVDEMQTEIEKFFAEDNSVFLTKDGLYSYDAYERKMRDKYDHPRDVVEVK